MSFTRGVLIGTAMVAIGSFSWASAGDPQAKLAPSDLVRAPAKVTNLANKVMPPLRTPLAITVAMPQAPEIVPDVAPAALPVAVSAAAGADSPTIRAQTPEPEKRVSLVEPPTELPRTKSDFQKTALIARKLNKKVSSSGLTLVSPPTEKIHEKQALPPTGLASPAEVKLAANPATRRAANLAAKPTTNLSPRVAAKRAANLAAILASNFAAKRATNHGAKVVAPIPQVEQAIAPAAKPGKLFSYVRLLNYSPHPQVEEFLKDKPLALKGKSYWFSVKYAEGWKTVTDEEGYLQDVSFEITLMEGDKKVRVLKTPKAVIRADKISKGQVLGIVEVSPYRFYITVDQYTAKTKGIAELVFKLDLLG